VSQAEVPREILAVHELRKQLGSVVVADDVNMTIVAGSIVGMVGPNGAGKTTMLSMLNGDIRPDSGTITFNGRDITRMTTASRARLGMARTYQIPRPFVGLTVFEHALLAAQQAGGFRGSEASDRAAFAVQICGMKQLANVAGAQLRLLDRKRLEIARAISGDPSLVLLDEVAGGLNDSEVAKLTEVILDLRGMGLTFLWVEHVVRALVATADRMVCLSGGSVIAQGTPADVLNDPLVLESYFGSTTLVGTD
jgi:branched-chain amino acid transport system ATP-binding protein